MVVSHWIPINDRPVFESPLIEYLLYTHSHEQKSNDDFMEWKKNKYREAVFNQWSIRESVFLRVLHR